MANDASKTGPQSHEDDSLAGVRDASVPTLRALLAVPGVLAERDVEAVRVALERGRSEQRGALHAILVPAADALLHTSAANGAAYRSSGVQRPMPDAIDALCAQADLDTFSEQEREYLLQWQLCYAMLDGVMGSDARSIVLYSETYLSAYLTTPREERESGRRFTSSPEAATVPGMLTPALFACMRGMREMLDALAEADPHRVRVAARALCTAPPPDDLLTLVADPERLFERLLLEEQIAIRQTVEHQAWQQVMRSGITLAASRSAVTNADPEALLRALAEHRDNLAANAVDTTWNAATPFVRTCVTLGEPAFDLPLAILSGVPLVQRVALQVAAERLASTMSGARGAYMQDMARSLARFNAQQGDSGERCTQDMGDALAAALAAALAGRLQDRATAKPETRYNRMWKDVFPAAQKHELAMRLVETLGFIPSGFYATKAFREEVHFSDIASLHEQLQAQVERARTSDRPGGGYGQHEECMLHARSTLLSQLFLGGAAGRVLKTPKARRRAVRLDARGIRIDITAPHDSRQRGELHAHVPYVMATDALLNRLVEEQWIGTGERDEVQLERARRQNDLVQAKRLEAAKTGIFAAAIGVERDTLPVMLGADDGQDALLRAAERERRFPASVTAAFIAMGDASARLDRCARAMQLFERAQARMAIALRGNAEAVPQETLHAALLIGVLLPVIEALDQDAPPRGAVRLMPLAGGLHRCVITAAGATATVTLLLEHLPRWHREALLRLA